MNIMSDPYYFLNDVKTYQAGNTIKQNAYNLKKVISFCDIFQYDIFNLDYRKLSQLSAFLLGYSQKGETVIEFLATCSKTTARSILETYSSYCHFLGQTKQEQIIKDFIRDEFASISYSHFGKAEKRLTTYKPVPEFISHSEYNAIIEYIRNSSDRENIRLRDELIVRIGYQSGRIGEILGSTLEDFVCTAERGTDGDLKMVYYIICRNRMSDKTYQSSKGSMKVKDRSDYQRNEYNTETVGYWKLYINEEIYKLFERYVDSEHQYQLKKHPAYYETAKADSVGDSIRQNYQNYYVFLNDKGSALAADGFSKKLRKIFKACGIEVDRGHRKHNLFHRFRHGFAMFYIYAKNGKELFDQDKPNGFTEQDKNYLRILMRHRSISSLDDYFNPTDAQIHEYKEAMEKEMGLEEVITIYEKKN